MGISGLAASALLIVAGAVGATPVAGIVAINLPQGVRLFVPRPLLDNEPVQFQYPGPDGAPRCCLRFGARRFSATTVPAAPATDAASGEALHPYVLRAPPPQASGRPFYGAAVLGSRAAVRQRADGSLGWRAGQRELRVVACTSAEGLHVIGTDGAGTWSDLYLGFDYTVEQPSCPPR